MTAPIELWYWPTPNGWKISIALEEMGLAYQMKPVNIGAGEQFDAAFQAVSPNGRMPAIVDPDGPDGQPQAPPLVTEPALAFRIRPPDVQARQGIVFTLPDDTVTERVQGRLDLALVRFPFQEQPGELGNGQRPLEDPEPGQRPDHAPLQVRFLGSRHNYTLHLSHG